MARNRTMLKQYLLGGNMSFPIARIFVPACVFMAWEAISYIPCRLAISCTEFWAWLRGFTWFDREGYLNSLKSAEEIEFNNWYEREYGTE